MSNQSLPAVSWFALMLLPVGGAGAAIQAPASTPAQTHACSATVDPAERLACYDAAFPPVVDIADFQADKARREFGLDQAEPEVHVPTELRDASPDRIEASVAAVDHRPSGERVITLDNGQVWMLTQVTTKGHMDVGDEVVIRAAALGSYMLRTPGRANLRVRRVR